MTGRPPSFLRQLGSNRSNNCRKNAEWRGEKGRTEVWYATFTDEVTGTGVWVHHEMVAPKDGAEPYAHGWTAVFAPDAPPVVERFGPEPVRPPEGDALQSVAGCHVAPGRLDGSAGTLAWDLAFADDSPPLYTFPRRVWERHLLPGAQIVPWPDARFTGTVTVDGKALAIAGRGALARIYGHGSAQRWGWLHADLPGGGTLEIVTATARRPGLRALPPTAMVQLRLPGEADWPRNPLLAGPRFRTRLHADGFTVRGKAGGRRIDVEVTLPADRRVALRYVDPDGATATCTNSEVATATVAVAGPDGAVHCWVLDATAHAEVGSRP